MTLCAAWIRQLNNVEELVFATDSALTGGEKWDNGIKLFELPRKDCLLCFTGSTGRAYPLILNLVSAIRFNRRLESPATGIVETLNYVSELFTSLTKTIVSEVQGEDIHDLRAEAGSFSAVGAGRLTAFVSGTCIMQKRRKAFSSTN